MPVEKITRNTSKFYALTFLTFVFIAILIFAGLMLKPDFGTAGKPKPAAGQAQKAAAIAGRYVGYTTLQTGICSIGAHELVIVIDEDGNAKSSYGMKSGGSLSGRANPDGRIRLNFREDDLTIRFEGDVRPGHITGRSSVSDDHTCDIYWDLSRS
jgi:hypothetical protein